MFPSGVHRKLNAEELSTWKLVSFLTLAIGSKVQQYTGIHVRRVCCFFSLHISTTLVCLPGKGISKLHIISRMCMSFNSQLGVTSEKAQKEVRGLGLGCPRYLPSPPLGSGCASLPAATAPGRPPHSPGHRLLQGP